MRNQKQNASISSQWQLLIVKIKLVVSENRRNSMGDDYDLMLMFKRTICCNDDIKSWNDVGKFDQ